MREAGALTPTAAKETGLLAGTPIVLGSVDVVCTGLGGGLFDPAGEAGCTVIGSTGMHMRLATSAEKVVLNPEAQRLHHAFPGAGHVGADAVEHGGDTQYRLAARSRLRNPRRMRA